MLWLLMTHSCTHVCARTDRHTRTHAHTHSLTHAHTHTHSFTHSPTHSLTHSLTWSCSSRLENELCPGREMTKRELEECTDRLRAELQQRAGPSATRAISARRPPQPPPLPRATPVLPSIETPTGCVDFVDTMRDMLAQQVDRVVFVPHTPQPPPRAPSSVGLKGTDAGAHAGAAANAKPAGEDQDAAHALKPEGEV